MIEGTETVLLSRVEGMGQTVVVILFANFLLMDIVVMVNIVGFLMIGKHVEALIEDQEMIGGQAILEEIIICWIDRN